jgi:hypothetical protein
MFGHRPVFSTPFERPPPPECSIKLSSHCNVELQFFSHLFNYNKWLSFSEFWDLAVFLLLFQFSDLTPSWEHPKRNIKLSSKWWQVSRTCLNKYQKLWLGLGVVFLCSFFFFCLVWISSFQNVIKLKSESRCGHKFLFCFGFFFFSKFGKFSFKIREHSIFGKFCTQKKEKKKTTETH